MVSQVPQTESLQRQAPGATENPRWDISERRWDGATLKLIDKRFNDLPMKPWIRRSYSHVANLGHSDTSPPRLLIRRSVRRVQPVRLSPPPQVRVHGVSGT